MAKTVDVDDSADVLQRLGKLGSDTVNRGYQPSHFGGRQSQSMSLPPFDVETLGLLRKHDETDDEEDKEEEEENEEGEIVVGNGADEGEVLARGGGEEGGESEPDK